MVELQDQRVRYEGDDSATEFPFYFTIEDESQVSVVTSSDTYGTDETTLTLGDDYTVTLNDDGTGTVILSEALPSGTALALVSAIEETQERTFPDNTPYYQEQIEGAVDKNCRLIQQILETLSRCVKVSATSTLTADELRDLLLASYENCKALNAETEELWKKLDALVADIKNYGLYVNEDGSGGLWVEAGELKLLPATDTRLGGVLVSGEEGITVEEDGTIRVDFSGMSSDDLATIQEQLGIEDYQSEIDSLSSTVSSISSSLTSTNSTVSSLSSSVSSLKSSVSSLSDEVDELSDSISSISSYPTIKALTPYTTSTGGTSVDTPTSGSTWWLYGYIIIEHESSGDSDQGTSYNVWVNKSASASTTVSINGSYSYSAGTLIAIRTA